MLASSVVGASVSARSTLMGGADTPARSGCGGAAERVFVLPVAAVSAGKAASAAGWSVCAAVTASAALGSAGASSAGTAPAVSAADHAPPATSHHSCSRRPGSRSRSSQTACWSVTSIRQKRPSPSSVSSIPETAGSSCTAPTKAASTPKSGRGRSRSSSGAPAGWWAGGSTSVGGAGAGECGAANSAGAAGDWDEAGCFQAVTSCSLSRTGHPLATPHRKSAANSQQTHRGAPCAGGASLMRQT